MELKTYVFFEEGHKDEPQFEIKAEHYSQAFDFAYECYGPQVDDLLYCIKTI